MTDHKFTDDDVIKALEICVKLDFSLNECKECPYKGECGTKDGNMPADALALIKRQKAEIERLESIRADLSKDIERLNTVHADAIESLRLAAEANKDMQAEIESLKKVLYELKMEAEMVYKQRDAQKNRADSIAKFARAEAIKDFAQRLKSDLGRIPQYHFTRSEVEWSINTIEKEMAEGTK